MILFLQKMINIKGFIYRHKYRKRAKGKDLLLEELIDHFIAEADRSSGMNSEKCSVIIRSAILEKPIQIPYRS